MLRKLKFQISKIKRKFLHEVGATKLRRLGYSELKYPDLLHWVRTKRKSDVLEIFGSGWSLNASIEKVLPESYKAGFNLAGYSKLDFDLYFFESTEDNYIGEAHRTLLNSTKIEKLVLKNLWAFTVNIKQIKSNRYPDFHFMQDVWVPQDRTKTLTQVNSIIEDSQNFCQIGATFTSLIAMGIQCEFKTIILHGVDFMGEHFFHSPDGNHDVSLNYGRLDCPDGRLVTADGKWGEAVFKDRIVDNKDLECANYVNMNVIPDAIILRALFIAARERGIIIKSYSPSVSAGILR